MKWENVIEGRIISKPESTEGVYLNFMDFGLLLTIRCKEPSSSLAQDIRIDFAKYRVIMVDKHIIFLARFGMSPWLAATFHRGQPYNTGMKKAIRAYRIKLHVVLVDAASGRVRARNVRELSPEISARLCRLIQRQEDVQLQNEDIQIHRIWQCYSLTRLVALAGLREAITTAEAPVPVKEDSPKRRERTIREIISMFG